MRANRGIEVKLDQSEEAITWLAPSNRAEYQALRRRAVAGDLREPFPGLFGRARTFEALSPRGRAYRTLRTLARLHPDWRFCSFSAAVLYGIHVPFACLGPVHLAVSRGHYKTSSKAIVRHACQHGTARVDGAFVTPINETVADCLCQTSFADGLAIADSALHWYLTSPSQLERYLADHGRWRKGIVQARRTLSYADGRAESGGESLVRAIIIDAGFVLPELQVEMEDPMGARSFVRVDFYWRLADGRVIVLEFDGLQKYLSLVPEQAYATKEDFKNAIKKLSDERVRESHINLTGATVLRLTSREVRDTSYVVSLLERAGIPRR